MRWTLSLDEVTAEDGHLVGGKALALAALSVAGMAVPPTLCVLTGAYEHFVGATLLRPVISQELGRKRFEDMRWEEIWDAALRIRNAFLRSEIPRELADALAGPIADAFGDRAVVVRSSAPGEDAPGASFAGLHDSIVGVQGTGAVLEAVRAVWASLWTDRALLYRRELGLDVDSSQMAVVMQELVEGACSGVAFGVHPTDSERVAVEAVYGLNQGLVDGTIEPDRWTLARETGEVLDHHAPAERRCLVRRGSDLVVEVVPPDRVDAPPLGPQDLARVYGMLGQADTLFGGPQDVEWTVSDGRLVFLQSRPVTTVPAGEGDKRAWYLSLTRSLDNLRGLRQRVENELLPAMDREADELGSVDLSALDPSGLEAEIERRRAAHDRWVDVYWREFIPLAHGIRLFGQFYDETVRPEDPYEFMSLLATTPMLSTRRNEALAELAAHVRGNDALRSNLAAGVIDDAAFERSVQEFEQSFGAAVFEDEVCFAEQGRLIRLVLALADAPALPAPASTAELAPRLEALWAGAGPDRRELAEDLLDLGRAAYRLRDDDNLHLARLEALVLEAVDARRGAPHRRHPNQVAEPRAAALPLTADPGFRAQPRQLVGQPAGPGVAAGPARVVSGADDLFRFRQGEVLVCDAIDPNMTFVVPLASGVVERRGGMLVHGAIIAREYGLPCVTGVPDVTAQITTGDHLTVDGFLGIVTVTRPGRS